MQIGYVQLANVHIGYAREYAADKRKIYQIGCNFSSETVQLMAGSYKKTSENHIRTLQHQKSQLESVSLYEDSNWLYYIHSTLVRIASITASPTRAKLARR